MDVRYTPDGRSIITGSADRSIRVWDIATGKVQWTCTHSRMLIGLSVSPDGKRIAGSDGNIIEPSKGSVKIWEFDAAKPRRP